MGFLQYDVAVSVVLGHGWITGHANNRKPRLYLAPVLCESIPVHAGHHDIGEYSIDPVDLHKPKSVVGVAGHLRLVAKAFGGDASLGSPRFTALCAMFTASYASWRLTSSRRSPIRIGFCKTGP
jgi:hypothetical protein